MWTIITRVFKDRRPSLLVYCLAGIGFLWMYIAIYPSIASQADRFNELFQSYPEGILKAFGVDQINLSTLENYIAMEHFSLIWPLMMLFFVVSIAANALAGEIERGTIELVLSRPISRWRLFVSHYLFGVFALVVFIAVTILAAIPLAELHNITYNTGRYFTMTILGLLFGLAVLGVSFLLSALFSEKSRVSMIMGGWLVVMYVLNVAASLKESLDGLKYASFFHYFDYQSVITGGSIPTESVWVFLGVAVISAVFAGWRFKRRDICA